MLPRGFGNMTKIKLGDFFTNENPRKVWSFKDEAPQWLKDAVREAHNGDLPNDWIYSEARDVCRAIDDETFDESEDYRQDHGQVHEYADGAVDIYTKALYQWQADMCLTSTYSYAEEELEGLGMEGVTGEKRVAAIQYNAIEGIANAILQAWDDSREAEEEEDGQ